MDVQLPDGTLLQGVPDGTTKEQIAGKLKASGREVPAEWMGGPSQEDKIREVTQASGLTRKVENVIGEPALQAASGAYHAAKGGLKGLADIATGQGLDKAVQDIQSEESKTYQPQSPEGQVVSKALGYLPEKQGQLARYLGGKAQAGATALGAAPEVAGGVGAGVETLGQVAGPAALLRGGKGLISPSREVSPSQFKAPPLPEKPRTVQTEMVEKARAAGYVLKPSEAGGKVGKVAEGLSGSPRLSIEASLRNQPVTNKLASQEIGLPEGTRLTRESLRKAKAPHNGVYKEVSSLGEVPTDEAYKSQIAQIGRTPGTSFQKHKNPQIDELRSAFLEDRFDARDAVLKVRQLRQSSKANIKSPKPLEQEAGYAERQVADAIETQLERHAQTQGNTDLVDRFRKSRTELAKINTIETALVGNTGDVSATRLAKMQQRKVPLSGNLKLIADTADEFGEAMRDASKLKNKVPITVLEGGAGVAGAAMTAAHSPHVGLPLLGGMVARPLTRKYLLSEHYQKKLGKGPEKPKKYTLADIESQ